MQLMVDSAAQVTEELLAAVEALCRRKPDVWGRYLSDGHGAAAPLTAAEVAFLGAAGVQILLYANNATATSVAGTDGATDATAAVAAAMALGVPKGAVIVADLEYGWPVTQPWIQSWCATIHAAGFVPGLYGSLAQAYFRIPFANAVRGGLVAPVLISASWNTTPAEFAGELPAWNPQFASPETADQVRGWQACNTTAGGTPVDLGEWNGPTDVLWTPEAPAATAPAPAPAEPEAPAAPVTVSGSVSFSVSVEQAYEALGTALRAAGQIP